jgi:SAM-dependent methyltransferase
VDWSEGYVTGIQYTRGYYKELNPLLQSFAMALKGLSAPDLSAPFVKVELGCGYGLSLLFEAAAFPHAQFFGLDFNPAHINWAKRLANDAQLSNITFYDASFADLHKPTLGIPSADFVALHGVWTWINQENRNLITRYLQSRLNQNGIVMVSYNAHPGWSELRGLRELMMRKFRSVAGPTEARAQAAVIFAQEMTKVDGPYLQSHPGLVKAIEDLGKLPPRYLAHEYFNDDWHLFNHHDVAASLTTASLCFAATCKPIENLDALYLDTSVTALLSELTGSDRETAKDVYLNKKFRYDLYTKQTGSSHRAIHSEALQDFWVIASDNQQNINCGTVTTSVGNVSVHVDLWHLILDCTKEKPISAFELANLSAKTASSVAETLAIMLDVDALQVALPPTYFEDRKASSSRLNAALMQRFLRGEDTTQMSSPVTGLAHAVSDIDRLFMQSLRLNKEPAPYVWQALRNIGRGVTRGGNLIQNTDEIHSELNARFAAFKVQTLPRMQRLGLV